MSTSALDGTGTTSRSLMAWSLREVRLDVTLSMIASLFRQLAFLAIPWIVGRAIDAVTSGEGLAGTVKWVGLLAIAVLVEAAGVVGWTWWSALAHVRVAVALRRRFLSHIVELDELSYPATGLGVGDLSTRGTRDVESIGLWVRGLATWVVIGTTFVVLLPAMFGLDPLLLVVTLATLPFLVLVNLAMPPWFRKASDLLAASHSARADAVQDLLSAVLPVRGIGGEAALVDRHHGHSDTVTVRANGAGRIGGIWSATAAFVPKAAIVVGVWVGGFAVVDGRIGIGTLTTFALWMATITLATQVLVDRLTQRGDAKVAAERLAAVFALDRTIRDPEVPVELPERGTLEARGIVLRRAGRTVCGPVSLSADVGEWVAVSGPTGSGKSTLIRALRRASDPASGVVLFGATPLTEAALADVGKRIAMVAQRPVLFSGTIAENITLGGEYGRAAVHDACVTAAFDSVVEQLPDGLDTQIGENGGSLSGGQRQRLAIARAVLRDPAVLLLDDATSALDADTEKRMLTRLRAWSSNRVVVFASHRDAVLAESDRSIVLADKRAFEPDVNSEREDEDVYATGH